MSEVNETMIGLFPSKARALEDELASINKRIVELHSDLSWEQESFNSLSKREKIACMLHEKMCNSVSGKGKSNISCGCNWSQKNCSQTQNFYLDKASSLLAAVNDDFETAANIVKTVL